jgi:hypothetical protein
LRPRLSAGLPPDLTLASAESWTSDPLDASTEFRASRLREICRADEKNSEKEKPPARMARWLVGFAAAEGRNPSDEKMGTKFPRQLGRPSTESRSIPGFHRECGEFSLFSPVTLRPAAFATGCLCRTTSLSQNLRLSREKSKYFFVQISQLTVVDRILSSGKTRDFMTAFKLLEFPSAHGSVAQG